MITDKEIAQEETLSVLGTRTGKCDICKATKKILLLSYGFSLCDDCVNICTAILEQLQIDEENPPPKNKTDKQKAEESPKQKITRGPTQ